MSAKQLIEIERNSAQIKARSDEVWRRLVMKDFPDRPVPTANFRKAYVKYFKEKEKHLQNASIRLREGMKKLEEEKASRTITSLEVDPRAAKARAKFKASRAAPSGSRVIQKAMQSARTKGPLFSSKNVQFSTIHPPRSSTTAQQPKPTSPSKSTRSSPSKRPYNESSGNNSDEQISKKPTVVSRPVKRPQSSIFLPKR
ncbi:hypothetical protein TRICI_006685 [Trichomonascus ciferrii]|uniref:Elongin-A n=1 Tax=Trichomonascus ciferrii TaxID=44093 RepID=A0A642UEU8_9ASCO|nr:hypothetical protein TRICI_006685 [Trichomonascus ciferrii]